MDKALLDGPSRPLEPHQQELKRLVEAAAGLTSRELAELSAMVHRTRAVNQVEQAGAQWAGEASASMRGITLENVEEAFLYQPWGPRQTQAGTIVREALVQAAKAILRHVPEGPDRSVALRKLREVRMDCNSAITFDGRF
jgi:hypothetical protein